MTEGDYGWLDPAGHFYEAAWGEHQTWAEENIKKMPLWDQLSLKERIWSGGMGDVLMNHGWVLLHNPSHGPAFPTKKAEKRYTKAQADFLYGYFTDRGDSDRANAVIAEYDD